MVAGSPLPPQSADQDDKGQDDEGQDDEGQDDEDKKLRKQKKNNYQNCDNQFL